MKLQTIACAAVAIMLAAVLGARLPRAPEVRGDLNLDGVLNLADLRPFASALRDPEEWEDSHDSSRDDLLALADFNRDGLVDGGDITGFCDALRTANPAAAGDDEGGPAGAGPGAVDLDIDSDNNSQTNPPHRSAAEETAEGAAPGKFVLVNNDDDDFDGVQDKDENGMISAERDDLVPLIFEIIPGPGQPLMEYYDYDFLYGASVRLWRSRTRGDLSTDVVLPDHKPHYQHRVTWLGDLNCDGRFDFFDIDPFLLALFDPAGYGSAFPGCDLLYGDMNYDAHLDFFDIDPFAYQIVHQESQSYVPALLWMEGIAATTNGGATISTFADTDRDGSLDAVGDSTVATCMTISGSPQTGALGAAITFTMQPVVSPIQFDAASSISWTGRYVPLSGPQSDLFTNAFSAIETREISSSQAAIVLGDGALVGAPNPEALAGGGALLGTVSVSVGGLSFKRALAFSPVSDAARWRAIEYPDGPGGSALPILGLPPTTLQMCRVSAMPDPIHPPSEAFRTATDFHFAATVAIDENSLSVQLAPSELLVDVVSYNASGAELDRLPDILLVRVTSDSDPNHIVYASDLSRPIILIDAELISTEYPGFSLLFATENGTAAVVPATP